MPVCLLRTITIWIGACHYESLYFHGYVICASNAGAGAHPAWFYNLKSHPQVELQIQIQDRHLAAVAEPADLLAGNYYGMSWSNARPVMERTRNAPPASTDGSAEACLTDPCRAGPGEHL
jgi:hypothetical protein